MKTTHTRTILGFLLMIIWWGSGLIVLPATVQAQCGPMDVVFVIDDTSSLGGSINNIKAELNNILNDIEKASGQDYRLALVTFKDNVTVREILTASNRSTIEAKILALTASGGQNIPEASDEAINTVINGLAATGRQQVGNFSSPFRANAFKMVILITDAVPGGFDDTFVNGVDDVNMRNYGVQAKAKDIKISTIYVPTYAADTAQIKPILTDLATTTVGYYLETNQDGTGTANAIKTIIASCGSVTTPPPTIGFGQASEVKAGSVLFFNLYASDLGKPHQENTQINITNTDENKAVLVHLFWIDSSTCQVMDTFVCIPATRHVNLMASEFDPGVTGYLVAVAVRYDGVPISFNALIGTAYVKLKTGHQALLNAVSFAALTDQPATLNNEDGTATLKFDGVKYDMSPRVLNLDNFPSPLDGNSTLLVVNRFGGNLTNQGAVGNFGNLPAIFYNDAETSYSVTLSGNACQTRNELKDGYPRIIPRFTQLITQGRTGWLRFSAGDGVSIMGAMLSYNPGSLRNGGKNLRQVGLMDTETYLIPVTEPVFACQ
jgi:hypothetical protein